MHIRGHLLHIFNLGYVKKGKIFPGSSFRREEEHAMRGKKSAIKNRKGGRRAACEEILISLRKQISQQRTKINASVGKKRELLASSERVK